MLSLQIKPISDGGRASRYYFSQDNYYFSGELSTAWQGKGADKLGLKGRVDQESLEAMMGGKLPTGEFVGIKTASGEIKHRGGYDLTFSAPKSLSYLALVGGNDTLTKLHDTAVSKVLSVIESMAAEARMVKKGDMTYEKTNNLTFATINHDTSRELDPNLHTHALMMNLTECSDGKWRSLASDMTRKHGTMEWIMDNKIFLGMVYRSEVAMGLKGMGLEIEATGDAHGLFEIKHFDKALLEGISKRRSQITEEVSSMKSSTIKAFDRATQNTRKSKTVRDGAELRAQWFEESKAYGIEPKTYKEVLQAKTRETQTNHTPSREKVRHQAVFEAISHLSESNLTLSYQSILEKSLYFSLGSCDVDTITHTIQEAIQAKQLIPLDKRSTLFTTEDLIDDEKSLIQTLRESTPQARGLKRDMARMQALTDNKSIQKTVVEALFHKDSVVRIKQQSAVSREVMKGILDYADDAKKVRILTPSAIKSGSFHEDMNAKTKSVWQWLSTSGKARHAETIKGFNHQHQGEHKLPLFSHKKERELLIVDDVQRVSHCDLKQLLEIAEHRRAKVILLEKPLGLQGFKHDVSRLLDKANLKTFDVHDALKRQVSVHLEEVKDSDSRIKQCADRYSKLDGDARANTHLVASSQKEVQAINARVRENLKNQGDLSRVEASIKTLNLVHLTEAEKKLAKSYKPGLVMYHASRKGIQKLTIESVIQDTNQILVKDRDGFKNKLLAKHLGPKTAVYEEVPLKVAVGESLLATREMKLEGIKAGISIEVTSITDRGIKIKQGKKTQNLFLDDSRHHPLTYNYAKTLHAHDLRTKKNTILTLPAYALRKNTLSMVTESSKETLHILTDDADKASHYAKGMRENTTAIDVTLNAASQVHSEKYLDDNMKQSLITSLNQAIAKLTDEKQPLNEAERALEFAITCLSEGEAAFKTTDVLALALQESVGKSNMEDVTTALETLIEKGELVCGSNHMLSTNEALQCEEQILSHVREGKGQVTPLLTEEGSQAKFKSLGLTEGQADACHLITTTKDRFVMVQGYAGTGKTTMTTSVFDAIKPDKDKGMKIIAVAPTHQAVKELREIGIKAQTLKSFLIEQAQTPSIDANTLVLLDESSMVSNRDFSQLSTLVHKQDARCVFLGDVAQHQAIEGGKPSALLMREGSIAVAYMHEIVRQKNQGYKDAIQHLISGDTTNALHALSALPRHMIERPESDVFFNQMKSSVVEVVENHGKEGIQENPRIEHDGMHDKVHNMGLLHVAAQDYLSRTPECRKNTVVVIHQNNQRDLANQLIRDGLCKQGQIGDENTVFHKLVGTNHKTQELYHLQAYKGCLEGSNSFYLKREQQYFQIKGVDEASKTVILLDERGVEAPFLPEKAIRDGRIELFERQYAKLSSGEKIHFKKTDKEMGRYANERLTVSSVGSDTFKAIDDIGQEHTLQNKTLKDAHWDYSYTATSHAVQGMSAHYVIGVEDTRNKHTSNLRGFYISATRGVQHAMIYTNSIDGLKKSLTHEPDKTSALEALGKISAQSKAANPKKKLEPNWSQTGAKLELKASKTYETTLDAKVISDNLSLHAEQIVESLLGEPNRALSSRGEYRYGQKGSLAISMQGNSRGTWFNFESQERGNLIHLIQNTLGLTFKEALAHASRQTGDDLTLATQQPRIQPKKETHPDAKGTERKTKAYALKLAHESNPIHGTLAEKYLDKHRGILNLNGADLRFHPSVSSREEGSHQYLPALLAITRNKDDHVQAVQAIYLDETSGMKAGRNVQKRTFSSVSGSGVIISKGLDKDAVTYLAEGVETALSIRDAVQHERVVAVLGKQNFAKVDPALTTQNIVLCLDNDGKSIQDDKLVKQAVERLEQAGRQVLLAYPKHKGDFNDVAKTQGVEGVFKALNNTISTSNQDNMKMKIKLDDQAVTRYMNSFEIKEINAPSENEKTDTRSQDKTLGQIEREIY